MELLTTPSHLHFTRRSSSLPHCLHNVIRFNKHTVLPNMDLSLLWLPSDESSIVLYTVGQSEQVGDLGSGFQGARTVREGGDTGRDLAGDECMKIVHCSIHSANSDLIPASCQALG